MPRIVESARRPYQAIPRSVSGLYGRSLHRDHDGEWEYNLAWKALESWPVYAGWLPAGEQRRVWDQCRALAAGPVPSGLLDSRGRGERGAVRLAEPRAPDGRRMPLTETDKDERRQWQT